MTAARLDSWLERAVVLLLLSILAFSALATGAVRPLDFLAVQGLAALALACWIPRFWLGTGHRLLFPPFCWAILAFLGLALLRYWQADLEHVARYECLRLLVYACVFLLALNHLQSERSIQLATLFLVVLGALISFYALYQFATRSEHVWHFVKPTQYARRASGTFICPNHLAGFLGMVLPLGVACVFAGRYSHTVKILIGYGCLAILAGIAATLSRAGWAASCLALLALLILLVRRPQYRIPALAALGAGLLAALIAYQSSGYIQERVSQIDDFRRDARVGLWSSAWRMWQDSPLLGVGPGHFDHRFHQYRPESIHQRPGRVHNDYLNTLVDWGVLGAAIAGGGAFLLLWSLVRSRKYLERSSRDLGARRSSNRTAFLLGAIGSATALGVHSLFDFNLHVPSNALLLAVILAMAASHTRFLTSRHWVRNTLGLRCLLVLAAGCAIWILVQSGLRGLGEQRLLEEARGLRSESPQRLGLLKEAARREPGNFETSYRIGEELLRRGFGAGPGADGLLEEAVGWFRSSLEVHPGQPLAEAGIGMALDRLGRFEEAAPHYRRALELDPNSHRIQTLAGWHQLNLGDHPAAVRHFRRSLEIKSWDNHDPQLYLDWIGRMDAPSVPSVAAPGEK